MQVSIIGDVLFFVSLSCILGYARVLFEVIVREINGDKTADIYTVCMWTVVKYKCLF